MKRTSTFNMRERTGTAKNNDKAADTYALSMRDMSVYILTGRSKGKDNTEAE